MKTDVLIYFNSSRICIGDFHLHQSNVLTQQRLYFYPSMTSGHNTLATSIVCASKAWYAEVHPSVSKSFNVVQNYKRKKHIIEPRRCT